VAMSILRPWIFVALLSLIGCANTLSEQEYANAFKASAERYFAIAKENDAKPLSNPNGLDRKQRFDALARFLRENSRPLAGLAAKVRTLKPPPSYEGVHREWLELLDGQVAREAKHASAVESQDRELSKQLNDELISFLKSQLRSVLDEFVRVANGSPELKAHFQEMLRSANL